MLYALASEEMRSAELRAVSEGVTSLSDLMRRAGEALAREVQHRVPEGDVVVCCGPGNNGGDGWVAARSLHEAGRRVQVVAPKSGAGVPPEARAAAAEALAAGVEAVDPLDADAVMRAIDGARVAVDAVFGFGFRGPARAPYGDLIEAMNASAARVISADMPSGVDSDTGVAAGPAVRAEATITFSAPKPGLFMYPGAGLAGEVVVAGIGIPAALFESDRRIELPDAADLASLLPMPAPGDHKGSRGRVAVVAGSARYPGAAVLAVEGALRMGAGYVVAVTTQHVADALHASFPSALVRVVPAAADGSIASAEAVLAAIADADAVVAGPGLSAGDGVTATVRALLREVTPLLLDADALDVLRGDLAGIERTAPLLMTPHPGEAARLLGSTPDLVQSDRLAAARALAGPNRVCLLKGARTIVAVEGRTALVRAGNAGLARAGSGDVLSGMLGTLLAQGVAPFDAAVLGAFFHGRAAEHGTARLTQTCFTSADIVGFLPDAVREVLGG